MARNKWQGCSDTQTVFMPLLPQIRREVHLVNGCLLMKASPWRNPFVSKTIAVWFSKTSQLMPTRPTPVACSNCSSTGPPSSQGRPGVCVTDAPWFGDSPWFQMFQGHCIKPYIRLSCKKLLWEWSMPIYAHGLFGVFLGVPTPPRWRFYMILQDLAARIKTLSQNCCWTNKVSSTV
jgi:hypothetical protein